MSAAAVSNPWSELQELHWLALRMVPGLGPRRAVPLLSRFRTVEAIFQATTAELAGQGLPGAVAQSIASGCTFEEAADQQKLLRLSNARIVPFLDPLYPERLKEIFDPPLMLFARGRVELLGRYGVAVVGTRRPTAYGTAAAERLAGEIAATGLVITSGMARGIDTAAHKSVLKCGGDTIAVFGSGVDHIYPAENRKLAEEIAAKGLLLSEYPMGTPGHPQNFPVRNRIISGLSLGVLVVEGAQYSGSAITAQLAMEQGREVFAVPGNITSKMSWGPNLLIKQGAKLVQSAEDILSELDSDIRRNIRAVPPAAPGPAMPSLEDALGPSAPLATAILDVLRLDEPTHVDLVIEKLDNWSSSEVIAALFELQLLGLIRQLPGKNYAKVWGDSVLPTGDLRKKDSVT